MKGIITWMVAALFAMVVGLVSWPGQAQMERRPGSFFIGDTDGDGIVAPRDVCGLQLKILKPATEFPEVIPTNGDNLDLDNDAVIGPGDFNLLVSWVIGNYASFPGRPDTILTLNNHQPFVVGIADANSMEIEAQVFAGSTARPLAGWGVVFEVNTGAGYCAQAKLRGRRVAPIPGEGRDQYTEGLSVFEYTGARSNGGKAKVKLFVFGCQSGDSVRVDARLPADAEAGGPPGRLPTHVNGQGGHFCKVHHVIGGPMVQIPTGCSLMGDHTGECRINPGCFPNSYCECPVHNTCITGFWMDRHEVTIAEYKACVAGGGCTAPDDFTTRWRAHYYDAPDGLYDNYPVVHVTWDQAQAYCSWVGERLPTEAEWEYAARSGHSDYLYATGLTVTSATANCARYLDQRDDTKAVESYPPNPFGLYDMTCNVEEWIADHFDSEYYQYCLDHNIIWDPPGSDVGIGNVRGGSCASFSYESGSRLYHRSMMGREVSSDIFGLRCVYGGAFPN